jgi:hypothetical protein
VRHQIRTGDQDPPERGPPQRGQVPRHVRLQRRNPCSTTTAKSMCSWIKPNSEIHQTKIHQTQRRNPSNQNPSNPTAKSMFDYNGEIHQTKIKPTAGHFFFIFPPSPTNHDHHTGDAHPPPASIPNPASPNSTKKKKNPARPSETQPQNQILMPQNLILMPQTRF